MDVLFWKGRAEVVVEIGIDQLKIHKFWGAGRRAKHFVKTLKLADVKTPLDVGLPAFLKSLGILNQRVSTCLPRALVNLRFLEVPSTHPEEVANIIELQGVKQTPYSREEVVLTHAIIGTHRDGYSECVLAFCQHKFVHERVALLAKAGLKVGLIGVSSEMAAKWYLTHQISEGFGQPKGMQILIDCDSSFSDVIFTRDGKFLFSRNIPSKSSSLFPGSDQEIENFCREVLHVIELTTEDIQLDESQKAILMASIPADPELLKKIEARLGLTVEFLDPAKSFKGGVELQNEEGVSITPLLGFATKEAPLFNLIPEETKLQRSLEKKSKQIILTGTLTLLFLAAVSLLFVGYFHQKKVYLKLLEQEISKTQEIATQIEGKLMRTNLLERIKGEHSSFLFYLEKITELLPDGMYFSSIEYFSDGKISLKGNASEMAEVFEFVKALEEAKVFQGVKSEQVSKKKVGEDVLASFDIVCRL